MCLHTHTFHWVSERSVPLSVFVNRISWVENRKLAIAPPNSPSWFAAPHPHICRDITTIISAFLARTDGSTVSGFLSCVWWGGAISGPPPHRPPPHPKLLCTWQNGTNEFVLFGDTTLPFVSFTIAQKDACLSSEPWERYTGFQHLAWFGTVGNVFWIFYSDTIFDICLKQKFGLKYYIWRGFEVDVKTRKKIIILFDF